MLLMQACTTTPTATSTEQGTELKRPEASIPFIDQNSSIYTWQADGDKGVWVQDGRRDWYYAKLQAPCIGLDFATTVGFKTRGTNRLDRFGYVVVPENEQCLITSFTKSDPPPSRKKKPAADDAEKK